MTELEALQIGRGAIEEAAARLDSGEVLTEIEQRMKDEVALFDAMETTGRHVYIKSAGATRH